MNRQAPTVRSPATYQDVLDAPEGMVAELVGGTLHLQPRPAGRHVRASLMLGVELGGPFDRGRGGPGGWYLAIQPEVHLGDDVVVPDIAGWRRERMASYPETAAVSLSPDWVCEILSPSTRRFDLTDKRAVYAVHGACHLWLLDPVGETLEAFALREGAWLLLGTAAGDGEVRLPPFEAVGFSLSTLWS